jgi:5-methylcytosine-specific restriction enzyme subunit McrC
MNAPITVCEFAKLTTEIVARSLDEATISTTAFDWLCKESSRLRSSGASLVQLGSRRSLRLDNYVGVIETPCGTRIEILPKHVDGTDDIAITSARLLLRKMLAVCMNLAPRESSLTSIQAFDAPINEWVMQQFLDHLDRLVKRGLCFDYRSVKEQQRFLRGRLDVTRQIRQPPGRQHILNIEHDVFDPDRAENRLLRSALDRVCRMTRDAASWRLAHELAVYLSPIPGSANIAADFRGWRDDRLMAHYRPVRPWCSLILNEQSPHSIVGDWHGPSLLFPMERLFERYVEVCLRRKLPLNALKAQASSEYLCTHQNERWFQLKPDFLARDGEVNWVVDTKWKRIDSSLMSSAAKYNLSQSDFYQLFAYGQRYLAAAGRMMLIYPMTANFREPLPVFDYSDSLELWVVPFNLEAGELVLSERIGGVWDLTIAANEPGRNHTNGGAG